MLNYDAKSGLTLRVIWFDDNLIELACSLTYGKFDGESTCYTSPPQLHDFADALSQFSRIAEGQPSFKSGLSDSSKVCDLRAYKIDKAGQAFFQSMM
jgi:hypothetical protein